MKTLFLFLASLLLTCNVFSQDLPKSRFCFGAGLDIGFFYPSDVNNFIENDLPDGETTFGYMGIFANFGLHVTLGYKIYKHLEFQWLFEGVAAPKYVSTNVGDYSYNFWRVSSGVMGNFHIPMNSTGKHSFYFGIGPILHSMTFKKYSSMAVGPRLQLGVSLNNYKFNPQIYLAGDYASANDQGFNLDYSSVKIGCNVNF
jgi:hypothetical protein